MSNKSTVHAALDKLTTAAIGFAPAEDALALLVLRNAVADAVRELPDAPTMAILPLTLAELRKHTALLETLGKQGDTALIRAAARWDASSIRVAPNSPAGSSPFDPVFECEEKDGKLIATISLRPGVCAYLVNAAGPRSPAIKFSADGPKHVQVAPLVEILP